MNDWRRKRSKFIIKEALAVCTTIVFIVIGVCCEANIKYMDNDIINSNFTLIILQIQATIDTLTISIIALIRGSISDSYMGIVFSDYYLNIRPLIFKQKRIIVSSLLLLAINIGFYIMDMHCLILGVFAITIVFVLMSISEIYLIFNRKRLAEQEIRDYVNSMLEEKCAYGRKYILANRDYSLTIGSFLYRIKRLYPES